MNCQIESHNIRENVKKAGPGRPAILTNPERTTVTLDGDQLEWLRKQPGGVSAAVRRLVDAARGV